MNQEYRLDREYSIAEIIQCNLRKWWLALNAVPQCAQRCLAATSTNL